MYLKKIPALVQRLYPEFRWRLETGSDTLYLTFDDGPTPEITDWVLAQLAKYEAQASFFCIGKNVLQYPEIAHRILDAGHAVGNHSQHHLNGWKTVHKTYLKDILQAQQTIQEYTGFRTRLYRPPYGRISRPQAWQVRKSHHIIMMDVISGDFDKERSGDACARTVIQHSKPGSIVLMHDSLKAWPRLEESLPLILAHFSEKGYQFKALELPWVEELVPA